MESALIKPLPATRRISVTDHFNFPGPSQIMLRRENAAHEVSLHTALSASGSRLLSFMVCMAASAALIGVFSRIMSRGTSG
jgi:hypothetical protein